MAAGQGWDQAPPPFMQQQQQPPQQEAPHALMGQEMMQAQQGQPQGGNVRVRTPAMHPGPLCASYMHRHAPQLHRGSTRTTYPGRRTHSTLLAIDAHRRFANSLLTRCLLPSAAAQVDPEHRPTSLQYYE